jgi:ABC-type antimicrobial peptide transport system permease subunit
MVEMARLGLRELLVRRRTALGLVLGISVVLLVFLSLEGISTGVARTLSARETGTMVVLQEDAVGFWGSYLPLSLGKRLRGLGAERAVPQIFVTRERAPGEMLLFRGVPLDDYRSVIAFEMVAGRPLVPGDHRQVMIGADTAEAQGLGPGDRFAYQGRDFTVKGVFETGLLADSEVWLDLKEADRLFNAQGYVSTFAIEDDPALARRIEQRLELEVVSENEVWQNFNSAGRGLFALLRLASGVAAVASVLGAMNVMFTMVRQRRRQIAILRSIGFGRRDVLSYVFSQSLAVSVTAFLVAAGAALLFVRGLKLEAMGMTLEPAIGPGVIAATFVLTLLIGLLSGLYPAILATRLDIADTMRGN